MFTFVNNFKVDTSTELPEWVDRTRNYIFLAWILTPVDNLSGPCVISFYTELCFRLVNYNSILHYKSGDFAVRNCFLLWKLRCFEASCGVRAVKTVKFDVVVRLAKDNNFGMTTLG